MPNARREVVILSLDAHTYLYVRSKYFMVICKLGILWYCIELKNIIILYQEIWLIFKSIRILTDSGIRKRIRNVLKIDRRIKGARMGGLGEITKSIFPRANLRMESLARLGLTRDKGTPKRDATFQVSRSLNQTKGKHQKGSKLAGSVGGNPAGMSVGHKGFRLWAYGML